MRTRLTALVAAGVVALTAGCSGGSGGGSAASQTDGGTDSAPAPAESTPKDQPSSAASSSAKSGAGSPESTAEDSPSETASTSSESGGSPSEQGGSASKVDEKQLVSMAEKLGCEDTQPITAPSDAPGSGAAESMIVCAAANGQYTLMIVESKQAKKQVLSAAGAVPGELVYVEGGNWFVFGGDRKASTPFTRKGAEEAQRKIGDGTVRTG